MHAPPSQLSWQCTAFATVENRPQLSCTGVVLQVWLQVSTNLVGPPCTTTASVLTTVTPAWRQQGYHCCANEDLVTSTTGICLGRAGHPKGNAVNCCWGPSR
jgi:hypothetical protein